MTDIVLHRAPYVVTVSHGVIENGAVLVAKDHIVAVDTFESLRGTANVVDHEEATIVPSLINCHAHLELSFLKELGQKNDFFEPGDITAWISKLLEKREIYSKGIDADLDEAKKTLKKMLSSGIVGVADIGNLTLSNKITKDIEVDSLFFLEMLGIRPEDIENSKKRIEDLNEFTCTGHAPYSTGSELLVHLKKLAASKRDLFSIHVAESLDELEFLKTGAGKFKDFLSKRFEQISNGFVSKVEDVFVHPRKGAVAYLNDLGILDENTICVHCVHVDDKEIDLLAKKKSHVCLCPGSNKYMGVGKPKLNKYIDAGLNLSLGTDSLASNSSLNLWNEMKTLAEQHRDVDPEKIFHMATAGGAEALKMNNKFGSVAVGKSANILAVRGIKPSAKTVYENLVNAGKDIHVEMVKDYHG